MKKWKKMNQEHISSTDIPEPDFLAWTTFAVFTIIGVTVWSFIEWLLLK